MNREKERHEFTGTLSTYREWKRKLNYEYKTVKIVSEHNWYVELTDTEMIHVLLDCYCYTQEEQEEIDIYGDPEHEEYLLSDEYEADCRSEQ